MILSLISYLIMNNKILFIVTGLEIGGLEMYLLRFLSFSNNRIKASILSKSGQVGRLDTSFSKLNTTLIHKKVSYFPSLSWIKIYKLFKKNKYDTIVDFTGTTAAPIIFIAWLCKVKRRIIFYRSSNYAFSPTFLRRIYIRICVFINLRLSTKILSNSNAAFRNFFKDQTNDLFKIIKNGIPFKSHGNYDKNNIYSKYKIPKNSFIVGHIGRFVESKNHIFIMKVSQKILEKYKDVYFILCGKNVEKNLKSNEVYNRYSSRFIFIDSVEDVYELHQIFNCFIFPSIFEGHPNALLECINSKVPILTSNVDSIAEHLPRFMSPVLLDLYHENAFVDKIINYYNGKFDYNLDEASKWSQNEFDCNKCFEEFILELI